MKNNNEVSFCEKDNCIKVKGDVANILAFGILIFTILMGLKALNKA
jgi:hypothetical protein